MITIIPDSPRRVALPTYVSAWCSRAMSRSMPSTSSVMVALDDEGERNFAVYSNVYKHQNEHLCNTGNMDQNNMPRGWSDCRGGCRLA